jgi:hypothetical protein
MALEQIVYGKSSIGNTNTNTNTNTNASAAHDKDNDDPLAGLTTAPVAVEATCRMMHDILYDGQGEIGANLSLGGVYQHIPYLRAIQSAWQHGCEFAVYGTWKWWVGGHVHSRIEIFVTRSIFCKCQTTRRGRHRGRHSQ